MSEPTNIENITRKIAGFLRLAENAGTQEEATTAAAKAQAMMDQYHIDAHTINLAKDNTKIKIDGKTVTGNHGKWAMMTWKKNLIAGIARVNGLVPVFTGPREVQIYGRTDRIELVEYISLLLCREIERLALEIYWPAAACSTNMNQRTWVQHFGVGAARKIYTRMMSEREARESGCTVTALVLADKEQVDKYIAEKLGKLRNIKSKRKVSDAMVAGFRAADQLSWHESSPSKQIE